MQQSEPFGGYKENGSQGYQGKLASFMHDRDRTLGGLLKGEGKEEEQALWILQSCQSFSTMQAYYPE
jgi:hypothetical protein